tara:strand:+ start:109 stop:492 length:384 start_codon:yes stop_codon:yes gene_type:complete
MTIKMTRKSDERPTIKTLSKERKPLDIEFFQNETLRPILKMKNDVIIEFFNSYIQHKKINWRPKSIEKKEEFIYQNISKDNIFKNAITHLIVGNFTLEEYLNYSSKPKEHNKRIWKMIQQRISSQLT